MGRDLTKYSWLFPAPASLISRLDKSPLIAVVASGPSAKDANVQLLRDVGAFVIAVNRSYELVPWADIIYGTDKAFWRMYPKALDLPGIKVMPEHKVVRPDMCVVAISTYRSDFTLGQGVDIGSGGNSGFQALNIGLKLALAKAVSGAENSRSPLTGRQTPVLMIGYDMHLKDGKHWHEDHDNGNPLRNPKPELMRVWASTMNTALTRLVTRRTSHVLFDVVNASPTSAITAVRHETIEDVVAKCVREKMSMG